MTHLGVYVQVPFCPSKCSFCNFSSSVAPARRIEAYAQALEKELASLSENCKKSGVSAEILSEAVDTIYMGGGTPPLLGKEALQKLVQRLRARLDMENLLEFTVEMTPGSADSDFLQSARAAGVNRLSIGAQSFIDLELRAVGRLHDADEIRRQVRTARQCGFENIGLDLIGGLPYQTQKSWSESLEQAVSLRPEHLSVYLFEIDEKSRLGGEVLRHGDHYHAARVPDDDFMADAYERARECLNAAGYHQYEISNFALPGKESAHNRKYWRLEPYIGIGAGAHSFDGTRRWSNEVSAEAYIEKMNRSESPIVETRVLSDEERMEEYYFLGLRQSEGVNRRPPRERCVGRERDEWAARIDRLLADGRLEARGERIRLPEREYLVSNEVFQEFLV